MTPPLMPRHLWAFLALYTLASLTHFTHNAEFIASYPNMPALITRENVYVAWLAIASVGLVALGLLGSGWRLAGLIALAVYGLLGLDGLAHYTLALCSEHTLAMNATIWFEVAAGVLLAAGSVHFFLKQGGGPRRA